MVFVNWGITERVETLKYLQDCINQKIAKNRLGWGTVIE